MLDLQFSSMDRDRNGSSNLGQIAICIICFSWQFPVPKIKFAQEQHGTMNRLVLSMIPPIPKLYHMPVNIILRGFWSAWSWFTESQAWYQKAIRNRPTFVTHQLHIPSYPMAARQTKPQKWPSPCNSSPEGRDHGFFGYPDLWHLQIHWNMLAQFLNISKLEIFVGFFHAMKMTETVETILYLSLKMAKSGLVVVAAMVAFDVANKTEHATWSQLS